MGNFVGGISQLSREVRGVEVFRYVVTPLVGVRRRGSKCVTDPLALLYSWLYLVGVRGRGSKCVWESGEVKRSNPLSYDNPNKLRSAVLHPSDLVKLHRLSP